MAKRLKHEILTGPDGEIVKVSWMPGRRLRIDFVECGPVVVTKIFPSPKITHVEFTYGKEAKA